MKEREAFEAEYSKGDFGISGCDLSKHADGSYINDDAFSAFFWFKAGLAHANVNEQSQAQQPSEDQRAKLVANMLKYLGATKTQAKAIVDGVFDGERTINGSDLQSQAQQESQWMPIEAAPKNTKIIVRYKNIYGKDRTVFAKYIEKFTEEAATEYETDYCESDDTYYLKEGWVELIDNWDEFSSVYFDSQNVPTHWMSIPPAPEVGEK